MSETADLDSRIMLKVAGGDLEPLGGLFVRYEKRLFGFFCRSLGNRDTAADLVQNTFFRVLRSRRTFKAKGHFSGWLFQIARSVVADYLRSRRDETACDMDSMESVPESRSAQDEMLTLEQALATLDPTNREILLMSRFSGMTYGEIGEATGLSESAIKVRVFRALSALKANAREETERSRPNLRGIDDAPA